MRETVIIILDPVKKAVHFTGTKLQGNNVWFPAELQKDIHAAIESIMVLNSVAHNVVNVTEIRKCGKTVEYKVLYNMDGDGVTKIDNSIGRDGVKNGWGEPEVIYLQLHPEDEKLLNTNLDEDVTWCQDKIYKFDVRYIREDLVKGNV